MTHQYHSLTPSLTKHSITISQNSTKQCSFLYSLTAYVPYLFHLSLPPLECGGSLGEWRVEESISTISPSLSVCEGRGVACWRPRENNNVVALHLCGFNVTNVYHSFHQYGFTICVIYYVSDVLLISLLLLIFVNLWCWLYNNYKRNKTSPCHRALAKHGSA